MFSGIGKKTLFLSLVLLVEIALPQVRINELMYGPTGGEPEWIELQNTSSDSVNIKNWKIRDKNAKLYTLSTSDFYIPSNAYLVITKSDTIFTFHAVIPSRVLICPALPTAFMVNTGDTISIHDSTGALVDSVLYQPSWGGSGGKSLERVSLNLSPFVSVNWGTSRDSSGSTPGRMNSIAARERDLKITSFSASLSLTNHVAVFKIMVKNSGIESISAFDTRVFLDYNKDYTAQRDELVVSSSNILGPNRGDSTLVVLQTTITHGQRLSALAVIESFSDDDTSNNSMWAQLNISYTAKSVVVNEIMYAPSNPEPEWVELFNASQDSVDLGGFTLADNSNTKAMITDCSRILAPSSYVIVADDSSFLGVHPALHDKTLVTKIPSLNNSGDAVVVHDASGGLIDSVNYSPSWGGNTAGRSLERILPAANSNDPQNFETCTDSSGSTPGCINSVTPRDYDLAVGNMSSFPLLVQSGGSVSVIANIKNVGLKAVDGATVIFFNDTDANGLFEAGEIIDSTHLGQLNAGDSTAASFTTGTLNYGTYHLGILVLFAGDERQSNNIGTMTLNVGLPSASVVINEIMYAPKSPELEWIELYNTHDSIVDLSNFRIATHSGSSRIITGSLLAPHDFAVLCRDSSVSLFHYPVRNLIIQPVPSLSNGGDGIGLHDDLGNLLDTASYEPSYGGSGGRSLERVDYFSGSDSTNWHESFDPTGATPGAPNSVAILPYDIALKRLELPSTSLGVSEHGDMTLVIENVGRNQVTGAASSLTIKSGLDGSVLFSGSHVVSQTLLPKDSALVNFAFTPTQPGTYEVLAEIFQQLDDRHRNDTLSAFLNVRYQPLSIIVNEIMYTSGPLGEYFEIYNASENPIDIGGWLYHTSAAQSKALYLSVIPRVLSPGEYYLVAADSSIFSFVTDTTNIYTARSLTLRDNGDCIVLLDPTGTVIDSVFYLPSWHNADIAKTSGRSLERINPTLASNDKTSWSTSVSQLGGTPGARNSLFVSAGQTTGAISVAPNPFSPDADGHDDFTFISYTFAASSVKIRVRIFDSLGRLIATPVDNLVLPSSGRIVWDGRDSSGRIVNFGLYILLVEVTGPDGKNVSTFKKPLVVAKKMR